MMNKHLFREMTWPEVNECVRQKRVVLVPVGAIEQHGYHLPVDVDNTFVEHICDEAARRAAGQIVSMPAIHYGYNSHNMDFPGTIDIKMQHFMDYCCDVGESLAHQGFRRIIFINGHGSNAPLCELIARKLTVTTEAMVANANHWQIAWDVITRQLEGGQYAADHACEWETSEYMALKPELVQQDKIVDEIPAHRGGPRWLYPDLVTARPVYFMNWWSKMNDSGVAGTPSKATAEKGQVMLETTITRLIDICKEFRDMPDGQRVDHRIVV